MQLAPAQPYACKSQTLAKPHIRRQERALERYCAHPDGCGHLVQRPMGYNTVASQPSVQVLKERNSQPRWFVVPLFVAHFSYRLPLPAGVLCCRALQSRLIKPLCPPRCLLIHLHISSLPLFSGLGTLTFSHFNADKSIRSSTRILSGCSHYLLSASPTQNQPRDWVGLLSEAQ